MNEDDKKELFQYVGLPKCPDCQWKLGSAITDNCACHSRNEDDPDKGKKHFEAITRARELQESVEREGPSDNEKLKAYTGSVITMVVERFLKTNKDYLSREWEKYQSSGIMPSLPTDEELGKMMR